MGKTGQQIDYFLQDYATRLGKEIQTFSDAAMRHLLHYGYPGNIRELRNIVEYCANVCRKKSIGKEDLPTYLFAQAAEAASMAPAPDLTPRRREAAGETTASQQYLQPPSAANYTEIEKKMILEALTASKGNRSSRRETRQGEDDVVAQDSPVCSRMILKFQLKAK